MLQGNIYNSTINIFSKLKFALNYKMENKDKLGPFGTGNERKFIVSIDCITITITIINAFDRYETLALMC